MEITTNVSRQLAVTIESARLRLKSIKEDRASEKPFPDTWSLKEILGHLIDSASNNHQRIVRMQEMANIGTLSYAQLHWVNSQQYQSEPWDDIVELWYRYNKHLAHIIEQIDPGSLDHICDIGYPDVATLRFVVEDYLRHLKHHLEQIFNDADPQTRRKWQTGS